MWNKRNSLLEIAQLPLMGDRPWENSWKKKRRMMKQFYLKGDAVLKEKIFFSQHCLSSSFYTKFFELSLETADLINDQQLVSAIQDSCISWTLSDSWREVKHYCKTISAIGCWTILNSCSLEKMAGQGGKHISGF